MKRRIIIILLLLVSFCLTACVQNSKTKSSEFDEQMELSIGESIKIGKYDNEDIEWIVLDSNKNGDYLLLSKTVLDCKPMNDVINKSDFKYTDWESCTLRIWLNSEFYYETFNSEEQGIILTTDSNNFSNNMYSTSAGNTTRDKVFFLSSDEVEKYFDYNTDRQCKPNRIANEKGSKIRIVYEVEDGFKSISWWLRTKGDREYNFALVCADGSIDYRGKESYKDSGMRPAIWINFSNSINDNTEFDEYIKDCVTIPETTIVETENTTFNETTITKEEKKEWHLHDEIDFGNYQGSDLTWIIIDFNSSGEALLLSKYAIDWLPYNNEDGVITWENSSIRTWLNNDFYNSSFNDDEKNNILETELDNAPYHGVYTSEPTHDYFVDYEYTTVGGDNTCDKIFLLSTEEAQAYANVEVFAYYVQENSVYGYNVYEPLFLCKATDYVYNKAYSISFNSEGNIGWWFRTMITDPEEHSSFTPDYVDTIGHMGSEYAAMSLDTEGNIESTFPMGVRPVMWVKLPE